MRRTLLATIVLSIISSYAAAEPYRVIVSIENLAPDRGTFQTPHWVGFHDGVFDIYNGGTPASTLPILGSVAVERLAEDGNNGPISDDFALLVPDGVDATIPGPNGAIGPGDIGKASFLIGSENLNQRYFSYASMVLPSNDFWYANGNPQGHPIFDENGNFIAENFFVTQDDLLDAGTEINDEIPENTAFFGQQTPDTGIDENGVIIDFGDPLVAFRQPEDGGNILADPRFAMADFAEPGYPVVKINFEAAPAITDDLAFSADLSGDQEVPPIDTRATGAASYELTDEGTKLVYAHSMRGLRSITAAHLHLAPEGENGPVVVSLLPDELDRLAALRARRGFSGEIISHDLTGPLTGKPLDALVAEILAGNVYINIHTNEYPSGELRGQLILD